MLTVLWLLAALGTLGAIDTIWYHEMKVRLPSMGVQAATELRLHAYRDFVYSMLFVALPWAAWQGFWSIPVFMLLVLDIVLAIADGEAEDEVRKSVGGLPRGERVLHFLMAVLYGALIGSFAPILISWWQSEPAVVALPDAVPDALRWLLTLMAVGVGSSGVRDLCVSFAGGLKLPEATDRAE
jgi:hypothetical protein